MPQIKRATLEALLLAARNTFPDEFIALLSCTQKGGKVIDEYVLLPATYGKTFSSIRLDLLPYTAGTLGSVHSHPSSNAMPSRADLGVFRTEGEIHLIIASPFNFQSVKAYNGKGKEIFLDVIE